jgi:hypothetical protein
MRILESTPAEYWSKHSSDPQIEYVVRLPTKVLRAVDETLRCDGETNTIRARRTESAMNGFYRDSNYDNDINI